MRLTIIPEDQVVIVDGYAINDMDMSGLHSDIHAVQWDRTKGHIEWEDGHNEKLEDVTDYQSIIDAHAARKYEIENPTYTVEEIKAMNKRAALGEQTRALSQVESDERREARGLVPFLTASDRQKLVEHAKNLDSDVLAPSEEEAYNPPLPPSIGELHYKTIRILVERVEGWQGALGWKATIRSKDESFEPTNLAMAWYNNSDCDGYVATTGAFQQDVETGEWFAMCPAGSEPGDVDIHLGLLLASAPMSCFTVLAGEMTKDVLAYEAG